MNVALAQEVRFQILLSNGSGLIFMTGISKDDLFVLCCLWDARTYRHHIASENVGIRFNISYKPLDVEGSINKLARLNLIDARRFAG